MQAGHIGVINTFEGMKMNLKLTLLALAAVIGLGVMTTFGAQAAATYPTTPPCTHDCDGGGGTYDPGEPFDPFCHFDCEEDGTTPDPEEPCITDCTPGGTIPDPDPCVTDCGPDGGTVPDPEIPGNQAGLKLCDAKIGDLDKVTARQIKSVSGRDAVDVVPVCIDKNLIDQQDGVGSLRSAIAKNQSMGQALGQDGYAADDVVGVIVGRTQAVLYVHAL